MLAPATMRPSVPTGPSRSGLSKPSPRPVLQKRRSTLKRSIDESQPMEVPSSPSKRSRVTFDSDIEVLSADEDENLDPLVVKEQVYRAIQRHLDSDDEGYDRIRSLFMVSAQKEDAPNMKVLKAHLQGLLANIGMLNKDCNSLVHAILNSEWIGRDETYFTTFVKFLGSLSAAHNGYTGKIMQSLVTLLGPQKTKRLPESKLVRQPKIHRRALQTIKYISQLVPTASSVLSDKVTAKLDFDFQNGDERMTYIKNFMELIKYVPELNSEILTNILRQLIKLDTAIQADLDDEEDDVEDEIMQHMSTSQTLAMEASQDMLRSGLGNVGEDDDEDDDDDDDDMSTTDESDVEDDGDLDPVAARRKKLKDDVKQVDMVMDILFQHYSKLTTSTTLQTRHNAIEQLIAQFHNLILPTHRSRHPQFLIFHFAQSDPIIVDRFVTSCVAVLIDKRQPQVLRHAAAAYFSGFVGRGAHVSPSVVQDCLELLCEQLNILRNTYEPACRSPDLKRYGDFYSIFQALMYIFCFRWRDIGSITSDGEDDLDAEEDDRRIEEYHFSETLREAIHSAIYSPLNPLRVCTPAIVDQFAKLTMILQFLYVYPKIEENKRVRIPTSWRTTSDGTISQVERDLSWVGENGMIEGYFPYDPYHLPISRHWIEGDYVQWKGLPGEAESDDEAEDNDFDEDEDDSDDNDSNFMDAN